MPGVELVLNLGAEPFAFAPPAGFVAWNTNASGGADGCASDAPPDVARAPIVISDPEGVEASTFSSDAVAPVELVVLGAYDTGGSANWRWNTDANGNPFVEPTVDGRVGSALVTLDTDQPGA